MKPGFLSRRRAQTSIRRDPAPSRWAYRIHRMWLTPFYRILLRVGLPVFLVAAVTFGYISNPANRTAITDKVADVRESIEGRPEFAVKLMAIEGASPVVDGAVRDLLPIDFPVSSFDLDLDAMQARVASLDVIEHVSLRVRPGGVLEVSVTEREPAVLWRRAGGIDMLDATGHRVASVTERAARPELPMIAGQGADERVREALAILDAAGPITPRIRGLVRIGERRWDIVLDRGQTIQLPEVAPVAALEQVLALDEAQDLLGRDITTVDMRTPARPTLRMTEPAVAELRTIRSQTTGASPR
ncbi:cell division protein FtsQ/DivIB [Maritimibacter sp. DP1N21-5]|uniref:cell division protein FtsQ/DivIB n=1 Tax=Maritimibacter sp. DP1N21-5 TaxID=2836867 RepID=UPI001C4600A0|nr:cell division protein FtsQ/DivIB [Maritimibacter sp. DP1N21-5]MBV7409372.1 cell division protein FtsQ/DivIB [Maritimibacter sp. DP1N21-5]